MMMYYGKNFKFKTLMLYNTLISKNKKFNYNNLIHFLN